MNILLKYLFYLISLLGIIIFNEGFWFYFGASNKRDYMFLSTTNHPLFLLLVGGFCIFATSLYLKKYPYVFKTYKIYPLKSNLSPNDIERYITQGYVEPINLVDEEIFLLFNNYSDTQNTKFNEQGIKFYIISENDKYFIDSKNICYHKNKEKYFLISEGILKKITK